MTTKNPKDSADAAADSDKGGKPSVGTRIDSYKHKEAKRRNIPTPEQRAQASENPLPPADTPAADEADAPAAPADAPAAPPLPPAAIAAAADRLVRANWAEYLPTPQLVWRGKLEATATGGPRTDPFPPMIYTHEKIDPRALIEAFRRDIYAAREGEPARHLFWERDFDGLNDPTARMEYYQHQHNWSNRMILGDSLQIMNSLLRLEGLRGSVQTIFFDPPYGINFNSNFQINTGKRVTSNSDRPHELWQIEAFRDTWHDGIHSYLSYARDRLVLMRELLAETGSLFLQIGDENMHLMRLLLDEIFGKENSMAAIIFTKKGNANPGKSVNDYLLWYVKDKSQSKIRKLFRSKTTDEEVKSDDPIFRLFFTESGHVLRNPSEQDMHDAGPGSRWARSADFTSQHPRQKSTCDYEFQGRIFHPGANKHWSIDPEKGIPRLDKAGRLLASPEGRGFQLSRLACWDDFPRNALSNLWTGVGGAANPIYVVQTNPEVVKRCILMTSDAGDLVFDPTCGSGTTAYVAEEWGRRWITCDTSRIALVLARRRLMGSAFPYYKLRRSGDTSQGFHYKTVPNITAKSIAENEEIDTIWAHHAPELDKFRAFLNLELGQTWEEWEIPFHAAPDWSDMARDFHAKWWELRTSRQQKIDASIRRHAPTQELYDAPEKETKIVRTSGPFTFEKLTPDWVQPFEPLDEDSRPRSERVDPGDLHLRIKAYIERAQIHGGQAAGAAGAGLHLRGLEPLSAADGAAGDEAGGPPGLCLYRAEFQTDDTDTADEGPDADAADEGPDDTDDDEAAKQNLCGAYIGALDESITSDTLRQAAAVLERAGLTTLFAFGFEFDPAFQHRHLGEVSIHRVLINPYLSILDLKLEDKTSQAFLLLGEPDIEVSRLADPDSQGRPLYRVRIKGIDYYDPVSLKPHAHGTDRIACWFLDTCYNRESFFTQHVYFPNGDGKAYESLKRALKADIRPEAWNELQSDTSRSFTPVPPAAPGGAAAAAGPAGAGGAAEAAGAAPGAAGGPAGAEAPGASAVDPDPWIAVKVIDMHGRELFKAVRLSDARAPGGDGDDGDDDT